MEVKIFRYSSLPSTNSEAVVKLQRGEKLPFVIIADQQTLGRGREKRHWYSPKGGLWFSIALPPLRDDVLDLLSLKTAVITLESLHKFTGLTPRIKLPNDLLVNDKKLSGLLIEIKEGLVIVGIGINTNIHRFPPHLSGKATSILIETGNSVDNEQLAKTITTRLLLFSKSKEKGQNWIQDVNTLLYGLNRKVSVLIGNRRLEGRFIGLTRSLELILEFTTGRVCYFPLHQIRNLSFQSKG